MRRNKIKESILDDISEYENKKKKIKDELLFQKQNVRNSKNNRNISIIKGITKFATPMVISSLIVYGGSLVSGFGRPFVIDKVKCSKIYTLESTVEYGIKTEEKYKYIGKNTNIPNNTFTIKTPWNREDNYYERTIYDYEEKNLKDINLYSAIISHDYDYIYNNYNYVSSYIERTTSISSNNDISIIAKIYIVDINDNIYVVETSKRNLYVTLFSLFVVLASSTLVILGIKDKTFYEINKKIYEYDMDKDNYYKILSKYEINEKKLNALKCKVKKYEKK